MGDIFATVEAENVFVGRTRGLSPPDPQYGSVLGRVRGRLGPPGVGLGGGLPPGLAKPGYPRSQR